MWSGRLLYVPEITSLAFPIPVFRKSENGRSASPYESTVANVKSISAATATAARARAVRLRRSRYDIASRTTPTTRNTGSKLTGGTGAQRALDARIRQELVQQIAEQLARGGETARDQVPHERAHLPERELFPVVVELEQPGEHVVG